MGNSATNECSSQKIIPSLYLINLDKRTDRLDYFKHHVAPKSKFIQNNCIRCSGIDGSQLSEKQLFSIVSEKGKELMLNNPKSRGLYLTKGAIGLALTYKYLLEACDNVTIIMEDDIDIVDNFDDELNKAIVKLPIDWDILYLGWCDSPNIKIQPINDGINYLSGQVNGTHGWIINPNSAKKLLSVFPLTYQIDTEIYLKPLIRKYSTNKKIVLRKDMGTDIQ